MPLYEAIKNFHEKWGLFVRDVKDHGISPYEIILGFFLFSFAVFFLTLSFTILFNGGLEYTVKIGK